MDKKMLDLYSDFLILNQGQASATSLAALLDDEISHDAVTRFLSGPDFDSKTLWKEVKNVVRSIENEDGALVFDDTVEEKEYSDESDLISWHYSHARGKVVKGLNLLTALAVYDEASIPVAFELIKKPVVMCDLTTRKEIRKSATTKNEMMREMLRVCLINIKFKYILADIWFNSNENIKTIHQNKKLFIIACKSNRKIALSIDDKKHGKWTKVSEIDLESEEVKIVYFEGIDFPLSLTKKVFKNKDDSMGTLYLISNEIGPTGTYLYDIYKKRWKVEEYHKSLKSNVSLKKSPARTIRTQSNHVFSSIIGFIKLETMKMQTQMNHFAMVRKMNLKANIAAMKELMRMKKMYLPA
jgi:transposase